MPAVSVIIPGLLSARYLRRRIESMLGSDTRNSSSGEPRKADEFDKTRH
jgi:hypothetical protein